MFLGLYNTPGKTSEILFLCTKDIVIRLSLLLKRLRGFCFNGTANPLGRFGGVRAKQ